MDKKRSYQAIENENKILRAKIEKDERNLSLFENITDSVCILDKKGNILDINAATVKLYGYSKEEMLKMNVSQLVYSEDKEISNKYFSKLRTEGKYSLYEGRVITKSKKIIWVQINSTKYFKNGIEIGSQDIIRDITEKKENELKILNQNIELKSLNATKDKFFSILAHDLKSPFSSLLGLSELLLHNFESFTTEKQKNFIENIYQSANEIYDLLENLLLWSLSQKSKLDFNPKEHNLLEIVNETTRLFTSSAKNKSLDIKLIVDSKIAVYADKNMLLTILRNLLSNAIKFTPKYGTVVIEAIQSENYTEISITDTGIGISDSDKLKLFKIDGNISKIGTNKEKGSGLGLIICQEFIEKHDCKIKVESELEKGSKFIFTLKNT